MKSSSSFKDSEESHTRSQGSVVVIIDDDDDDNNSNNNDNDVAEKEVPSDLLNDNYSNNGSLSSLQDKKQRAIESFMEIMGPHQEESVAIRELEKHGYDLQMAIEKFLCSSTTTSEANPQRQPTTLSHCNSHYPSSGLAETLNFSQTTSLTSHPVASITGSIAAQFVDDEFPPNSSSLDGRKDGTKELQQEGISSSKPVGIRCHCGWIASAKTVQSEGPNYGRFYLACGKKAIPAQRVVPVLVEPKQKPELKDSKATNKNTDNNATTKLPKNPYRKQPDQTKPQEQIPTLAPNANSISNRSHCNFFQWDTVDGSLGSTCCGYNLKSWAGKFSWHCFSPSKTLLLQSNPTGQQRLPAARAVAVAVPRNKNNNDENLESFLFRPEHVRQGAVGNCWFLSALAVVAEHTYLLQQILMAPTCPNATTTTTSRVGCYRVNLCLDGQWTPVVVDSYLPVVAVKSIPPQEDATAKSTVSRKRSREGILVPTETNGSSKRLVPAFCDVPNHGTMLWPALIEKAYAKAHGCYANLSGGFIAEAFADLTGAPTETIIFEQAIASFDSKDQLWARVLSFTEAGFLMGVATSQGGDGLVGGHAYSVLGVLEFHDALVGEQPKVTDFFQTTAQCQLGKAGLAADSYGMDRKAKAQEDKVVAKRETLRLVRIRNPWGQKEWKGAWSADSDNWTRSLRKQLCESYSKGDGTFFMSFDDMLNRFHHMDVAKCRKGWVHVSTNGCFQQTAEPMRSSAFGYSLVVTTKTWAFISVIQPKKRANTKTSFWYSDASLIIMKRRKASADAWSSEACILQGVTRRCDCETFLDPAIEYYCLPFAFVAEEVQPFRISVYSSSPITINPRPNNFTSDAIVNLHKELLKNEQKLTYVVASNALLVSVQGNGCLYFLGINGNTSQYLSLRMTFDVKQGVKTAFGGNGDTHDIPPRSQKILVVLSRDGKASNLTELSFQYVSDLIEGRARGTIGAVDGHLRDLGIGASVEITMAGDLLTGGMDGGGMRQRGGDTIDIFRWIPQIGAAL